MIFKATGGGGPLRNEPDDEVIWRHINNSHVIEENRYQNNAKATSRHNLTAFKRFF